MLGEPSVVAQHKRWVRVTISPHLPCLQLPLCMIPLSKLSLIEPRRALLYFMSTSPFRLPLPISSQITICRYPPITSLEKFSCAKCKQRLRLVCSDPLVPALRRGTLRSLKHSKLHSRVSSTPRPRCSLVPASMPTWHLLLPSHRKTTSSSTTNSSIRLAERASVYHPIPPTVSPTIR